MSGDYSAELRPAEVDAIVSLLLDGDAETDRAIAAQLLLRPSASRQAVLAQAEAAGVWVAMRLAQVLRLNRREELAARFAALPRDAAGDIDLEDGVLLVAEVGMPDVDVARVRAQLDAWAHDVHMATAPAAGSQGSLDALRNVLFSRLRLSGEHDSYYDPQNSCLPHVMDRRVGLPITLSVIVLLVARRLSLPVHGIGAPGHFLVRYDLPDEEVYLDAFDGGTLMTKGECFGLLRELGVRPGPGALAPVEAVSIVLRMLNNLLQAYQRSGDADAGADCKACMDSLGARAPMPG